MSFVHLSVHSEYSIVDSVIRLDDLIQRAVDLKMPAIALTDEMNLFAFVKFYQKAIAKGIKPILGSDIYLLQDDQLYHATLLCKNQQGLQHLRELLSRAYVESTSHAQVHIKWEWLIEAHEGLIVLSGGKRGNIGVALSQHNDRLANDYLQAWLRYFPNHFYLEIQRPHAKTIDPYLNAVLDLAHTHQAPLVATNAVCFLHADDFEAHEARVCIYRGEKLNDPKRVSLYHASQYLKSASEMREVFSDLPSALANTVEIARRCSVPLTLHKISLPQFPTPGHVSISDYLLQQTQEQLANHLDRLDGDYPVARTAYEERLEKELHVIMSMGFSGYFLIVADFINWAKQHDIPVGPGRGSGAGSLVAFLLGITTLDPLQHGLLFERFLNAERISMPDFDIDFCMEKRDAVIAYVTQRYGKASVAQIITYGTMAARAVLRDVGRVLGMPYGYVDKLAKLIPFELGMTLDKALSDNTVLAARYADEPEVTNLIDLAKKLEGLTRNAGKHAGGVVIAPTKLTDFVPLYCEPGGDSLVTQLDKYDVETVGLVKFDFLGLRTLTIIDWAIKNINKKQIQAQKPLIDIERIPLDDKKTYALLKRCETTAIFQLESRGIRDLIRRLKPDNFSDIMALVALFRPGPLQSGMVDTFIACKHGQQTVNYFHPDLVPVLRETHGVILYQEQVMQIAQVLAGYSLGDADVLRDAMGKKKVEEMARQRLVFLAGAKVRGVDETLANHIFDLMEKFSGYGFNKSHSAAYALIAYQTAWLKAHYPQYFMAAVLSSDMDHTEKVVSMIREASRMGLTVLPPNINQGCYHFTVNTKGEIEYGLGAIKGIGESVVAHIVSCREQVGSFKDLFDFIFQVASQKITRRSIEPLIRSGAMDCFNVSRAVLWVSLDNAYQLATQKVQDGLVGQGDLFAHANETASNIEVDYLQAEDWSEQVRLQGEYETLGFYLTGHPFARYAKEFEHLVAPIAALNVAQKEKTIAGMLMGVRRIVTKREKKIAILTLEDTSGHIDITVFDRLYEQVADILLPHAILIIHGKVMPDDYTGGIRFLAESIHTIDDFREKSVKHLALVVRSTDHSDDFIMNLSELMKQHAHGSCPVVIHYHGSDVRAQLQMGSAYRVKPTEVMLQALRDLCGDEQVTLIY